MLQWKKNGVAASNIIIADGTQIINPTPEQLLKAGYALEEEQVIPEIKHITFESDNEIQKEREKQYKLRSDSYFIASQKYLALGDLKKSEEFKTLWLKEIEAINNEYPYGAN